MNLLSLPRLTAFLIATSVAVSCSKKKDDDEGAGDGSLGLTGPAALIGTWTGNYRAISEGGKPFGDFHGAEITFFDTGSFEFGLIEEKASKAKGMWQEFQGTTVILTIKDSSFSRLPKGSIKEFHYDLFEPSLLISDEETLEFKVSRKTSVNSGESEEGTSTALSGRWICAQDSLTTRLNVGKDFQWQALLQSPNSGLGILSGGGHQMSDTAAVLYIASSNYAVKANSTLIISRKDAGASLVMNVDETKSPLGDCSRE